MILVGVWQVPAVQKSSIPLDRAVGRARKAEAHRHSILSFLHSDKTQPSMAFTESAMELRSSCDGQSQPCRAGTTKGDDATISLESFSVEATSMHDHSAQRLVNLLGFTVDDGVYCGFDNDFRDTSALCTLTVLCAATRASL